MSDEIDGSSLKGLAEAFQIMAKYGKSGGNICAEHDEIWAGHDIEIDEVSSDDLKRLKELGWKPSEEGGFHKYV